MADSSRPRRYQTFLADLKRRRVFKIAAAYGATGFVALEVADIIFPRLGLPDWSITLVVALILIGFPVALILAWALELTPEGVQRAASARSGELEAIVAQPRRSRWPAGLLALAGTALLLAGIIFIGGRQLAGWGADANGGPAAEPAADVAATAGPSVAVLPFADMSPDADQAYFADGVAEEILNSLARIEGLGVAARTSSFKLRDEDVATVGARLGVSSVLEGSVRKQENRVRVTVQLINVADGFHLWSRTFERELTDIFAVQDEIARAIARALRIELTGAEAAALAKRGTENIDAYNAYLLGRYYWNRRTREGLSSAKAAFEEAIERDPDYALAYAGLADAYSIMAGYTYEPPQSVMPRARAAALAALERDDDLAAGHLSLAFVQQTYDWDWEAAERSYRRALELDPNNAFAHYWHSILLNVMGRHAEAEVEILRGRELDPLAPQIGNGIGQHYMGLGEFARAAEILEEVLEVDPDFPGALANLGSTRVAQGRYEEALRATERYAGLRWGHVRVRVEALWGLGRHGEALALIAEARAEADTLYWDPVMLAGLYATVGDTAEVAKLLERAYAEKSATLALGLWYRWVFRHHPTYNQLMRRMGLAAPADKF